ncbi:MAG: hypothetical protein HC903_12775 [Methylacidiphilales bacterium]|nr:hypothetical protein [Candidatus Methylacidiphilales bacterium]NJR18054.1 hypothetical protein [Calothrix sp. CSU_2_0]
MNPKSEMGRITVAIKIGEIYFLMFSWLTNAIADFIPQIPDSRLNSRTV